MSNPVSEVTAAAKSAFTVRNIIIGLITFALLAIFFDYMGWTQWLIQPVTSYKAWAEKAKKAATVLIVFAIAAASTATNALWL